MAAAEATVAAATDLMSVAATTTAVMTVTAIGDSSDKKNGELG